jgi:hypothetical protein
MTMDVGVWLHGLGLGQYEAAFREHEIDGDVLPNLTADDLNELGVTIVGHRRKLLTEIASLNRSLAASNMAATAPPPAPRQEHAPDTAERRQLTVMFVDLVGSTAMSARLDPEDMREIVGAYHRSCAEQISKIGGFVAKYMGDGVLAYFGYPQAHEHDAERAVLAGLALVEPEVLAYHFSEAGLLPPAIGYWQAAGKRATGRAGMVEAVAYFDKALALLRTLPETPERDQQELMLLIGRGLPLTAIRSYAAADVGDNYRSAHALCKRMGASPKIFAVLQGLYRFYLVSAELHTVLDTTTQLLDIAEKSGDQNLLMEAHQALAHTRGYRGELQAAQELRQAHGATRPRALSRPHAPVLHRHGDKRVVAWGSDSVAQGLSGSLRHNHQAGDSARPRCGSSVHIGKYVGQCLGPFRDPRRHKHDTTSRRGMCGSGAAARLSILARVRPNDARPGARKARRGSGGDRRVARGPRRLEQDRGTDLRALLHVLSGGSLSGGRAACQRSGSAYRDHHVR